MQRRVSALDWPTAGYLVQEMIADGVEVFAGVARDPDFGLSLAFGLGGVGVEVLRDFALRPLPLREGDAEAMIAETRGAALLKAFRGRPAADIAALAQCLYALSDFAAANSDRIDEIDLNPIKAKAQGVHHRRRADRHPAALRRKNGRTASPLARPRQSRHRHAQPPEQAQCAKHGAASRDGARAALSRQRGGTSVIVLRAEGRSFCVGFDVGADGYDPGKVPWRYDALKLHQRLGISVRTLMTPWTLRKPVIASVQGHVLGGGCELAMFCDLTIAADNAVFGEPEMLFSHLGPAVVMPMIIGHKRARELLYFGDTIDAQDRALLRDGQPRGAARRAARRDHEICQADGPDRAGGAGSAKLAVNRGAETAAFATRCRQASTCARRYMRRRPRSARSSRRSGAATASRLRSLGGALSSRKTRAKDREMSFAAPNAHRLPAIAALSSFALALSAPCGAQDFYAGKSIQLVIGFDVGGG